MLTGLWHGAAWNFVLWGLLYAACLLAEKWIPALQKLPVILRRGYTLLVVVLGFVLFNAESMTQAGNDLAGMFGFAGVPLVTAETLYYLKSYGLLFVLAFVGATPLVRDTANRLYKYKATAILEPVVLILLLLVCSGYLVDGSFSPFLYFRF
jgi:alginate O-acetyltransferase complex protein AlgI